MKISLITTCLNEEKSIGKFLSSVSKQTKTPDEIIIVDAESKDATASIISNFKFPNSKIKIKLIIKKGNRSIGRNTAIKNSSNEIIACTDVGCELSVNWLERIIKPFENQRVDVVAGYYKPVTNSIFEECLATYTCTMKDKLDHESFLPSSRSVAFRKKAWEKVGGYPEKLSTCEDLVFDKNLKKAGMCFVVQENAVVYWPQRKNIWQAAKQFYGYAVGDGQAKFIRLNTHFLFARYLIGIAAIIYILYFKQYFLLLILALFFLLYIIWSIWKNYKYVKNIHALYILPGLQFISDITVMVGTLRGVVKF